MTCRLIVPIVRSAAQLFFTSVPAPGRVVCGWGVAVVGYTPFVGAGVEGGAEWPEAACRAAHPGRIHLDLYVPHQSQLGANLQLRTERLAAHHERHGRYRVLTVPAHLATKLAALLDRPDSLPGRKDRHEILTLLGDPAAAGTPEVVADASARSGEQQRVLIGKAFEFLVADSSLNRAGRDRLRRTSAAWIRSVPAPPTVAVEPPDTRGPDS